MVTSCFIVLSGEGINCEHESALALESEQIDSEIVHVNDLISKKVMLENFDGMIIPGGFSFGDELGSGRVLAIKIKKYLLKDIYTFIDSGKPILGVCNGFQVLEKLGLFEIENDERYNMTLVQNVSGTFIDKWVQLNVNHSVKCVWTNFADKKIYLPIRHGEGRVLFSDGEVGLNKFIEMGRVPLTYQEDINGSEGKVAAVTDKTGLVLGLMPHPECATYKENSISVDNIVRNDGRFLFESVKKYLEGHIHE